MIKKRTVKSRPILYILLIEMKSAFKTANLPYMYELRLKCCSKNVLFFTNQLFRYNFDLRDDSLLRELRNLAQNKFARHQL